MEQYKKAKSFVKIDEMIEYIGGRFTNNSTKIDELVNEITVISNDLGDLLNKISNTNKVEFGIMPEDGEVFIVGDISYKIGISYVEFNGIKEYSYWILEELKL